MHLKNYYSFLPKGNSDESPLSRMDSTETKAYLQMPEVKAQIQEVVTRELSEKSDDEAINRDSKDSCISSCTEDSSKTNSAIYSDYYPSDLSETYNQTPTSELPPSENHSDLTPTSEITPIPRTYTYTKYEEARLAANEIMTTEAKFQTDLHLLDVDFRNFITEKNENDKIVPQTEFEKLFSNIPALRQLSDELLKSFQECMAKWNDSNRADIAKVLSE